MAGNKKSSETYDIKKDSLVYKISASVGKWFLVSLLTWFCSIPVFTIGTASCAALAVSLEDGFDLRSIFGTFFSYFRDCFKKTVPFFLLFLLVIAIQVLNLSFYHQFIASGTWLYYVLMGVIMTLIIASVSMLRFYNYEVALGDRLPFRQTLSKAFSRMMRCLPAAGILALTDIGLTATLAGAPVVIPVLLIYPGFHSFLTCLLISLFENRGKRSREA